MTTDTYFETTAREYDARALLGHPCYREMLDQVAFALPERAERVLELGCGTGALTGILAGRYPDASLTAVDASGQMIEVAKERLNGAGLLDPRVMFVIASFETLELGSAYDLTASNMSLHHIVDKGPFYTRLRSALTPGGIFVLGDELRGGTPEIERRHYDGWLSFARRPGHLSEPEIAAMIEHIEQYDHYETLPRQLELLNEAGFAVADCTWRSLNYAVFVAIQ